MAQGRAYLIEITVTTADTVQFHIGATTVAAESIDSGYDTTGIALAVDNYQGQTGQAYFSNFIYGRD